MVGAVRFSPHPISLHFASWIDTLYGGARHHGHSELPQRPPTHSAEVSSPWRPEIRGTDRADLQIFVLRAWAVNRNRPQQRVVTPQICGKTTSFPTILHLPPSLINAFPLFSTREFNPRGVIVENILLRDVQLPAMLKGSIEAKQQAEQDALRMSFILQKETQEAQRKRIEAQGIADFQKIVAQGISPQLLEWKGIEATEKLATSANSKVVVIGNPKTGLPIILGPQ